MYLCDYHTHSNISFDGKDSLLQMVNSAQERGLSEICVTDHFDINWSEDAQHIIDIENAKTIYNDTLKQYKGNVKIRFGLELGQATQNVNLAEKTVAKGNFDFIIGSLHNCNKMPDFYFFDYKAMPLTPILKKYYKEMLKLCKMGCFDVLGHITYYLRYSILVGVVVDLKEITPYIADVFKCLVENGKGIEVNTEGMRGLLRETSPNFELIKLYRSLGGEIITIGSDAHKSEDIGKGISEAVEMIKSAGFKAITCYEKRKPFFVDI